MLMTTMIIIVIMMMVTNHVDENGIIMTVTNGNDVDSTNHGEEATGHPDDETHVDAARALKNSGWGDEDSAANDAADNDRAAVQQGHLCFQLHTGRVVRLGAIQLQYYNENICRTPNFSDRLKQVLMKL